jgi:hypothetical protein
MSVMLEALVALNSDLRRYRFAEGGRVGAHTNDEDTVRIVAAITQIVEGRKEAWKTTLTGTYGTSLSYSDSSSLGSLRSTILDSVNFDLRSLTDDSDRRLRYYPRA